MKASYIIHDPKIRIYATPSAYDKNPKLAIPTNKPSQSKE